MMLQKVDHVSTAVVVIEAAEDGCPGARSREGDDQGITDRRFRSVGHQDQPIRQIQRFIDVMRDHDDRLVSFLPDPQQRVLQLET